LDSTATRHQIFEQNVTRTVEAQAAIAKRVQREEQRTVERAARSDFPIADEAIAESVTE